MSESPAYCEDSIIRLVCELAGCFSKMCCKLVELDIKIFGHPDIKKT
jgi:hypothetical protein